MTNKNRPEHFTLSVNVELFHEAGGLVARRELRDRLLELLTNPQEVTVRESKYLVSEWHVS